MRWWDLAQGARSRQSLAVGTAHVSSVAAAVLPDGRVLALTGGTDGTVRMWDLHQGRSVGSAIHAPGPVSALSAAHLDNGRLAVLIGGEGTACVITADL